MGTKTSSDKFYVRPGPHLEQGDVFCTQMVAPTADRKQRVFRSADGRHGSIVFEEGCEGRVFAAEELRSLLSTAEQTKLHTQPFVKTEDGDDEMVVVYARLLKYFIIATQTCDICGDEGGRPPLDWACILPFITLADMCKQEPLEIPGLDKPTTIHEYVSRNLDPNGRLAGASDEDYGMTIRLLIGEWQQSPLLKDKLMKQAIGGVKAIINNPAGKGFLFYLKDDVAMGMPEGVVDFTAIFTVSRADLESIGGTRIARIGPSYRELFSQAFGNFFSRVATPRQMKPDKLG